MVSTAIEQLEAASPSPHVMELCNFIKASKRGVSKAFRPKTREAEDRSGLPHSDDTRRELNRVLASQDAEDAR
jgi:hypothetical protein